jgi:hypothetical protein
MPSPRPARAASPLDQAAKIPPDQLDSLVAPIALYPDPMLAQTLAASTDPLELIQLQQWLAKNPEPSGGFPDIVPLVQARHVRGEAGWFRT